MAGSPTDVPAPGQPAPAGAAGAHAANGHPAAVLRATVHSARQGRPGRHGDGGPGPGTGASKRPRAAAPWQTPRCFGQVRAGGRKSRHSSELQGKCEGSRISAGE